jgi:hypothetical protein
MFYFLIYKTKKRDRENEIEKIRLLKRQQLLRQTLNNLIQDLEAENFDYKAWLSTNNTSCNPGSNEPSELISRINEIEEEEMKMEMSNEDDGCESASTSTASEANDYMRSSKSKSKRSAQHAKMQPYQRKRFSNSLCIVHLSKVPKLSPNKQLDNSQQHQHQQQPKEQQKMMHMQHKLEMQQQQKQRHHSVDENMINRRRKQHNSLSINLGLYTIVLCLNLFQGLKMCIRISFHILK